jgi:HAMP domain-containing protein
MSELELPPRGRELWSDAIAARTVQERERRALVAALDAGSGHAGTAYVRWQLATGRAGPLVADLTVFNLRRLERAVSELERVRSRSVALLLAVLAASAALVVAFSLVVDRWLVRPVRAMTDAARRIARERIELPVPGGHRRDDRWPLQEAGARRQRPTREQQGGGREQRDASAPAEPSGTAPGLPVAIQSIDGEVERQRSQMLFQDFAQATFERRQVLEDESLSMFHIRANALASLGYADFGLNTDLRFGGLFTVGGGIGYRRVWNNFSPPGNIVIWRGLSRLTDIELGIMIGVQLVGN